MRHFRGAVLLVAGLLALAVAVQATDLSGKGALENAAKDFDNSLKAKMDALVGSKDKDIEAVKEDVDHVIAKAADPDVPAVVRNKARAYPALAKAAIALGKPDPRCPLLRAQGRALLQAIERPGNCTSCCYCPPGYYYNGEELVECPTDEYCSGGWFPYGALQAGSEPVACPPKTGTCGQTGAKSPADCACATCKSNADCTSPTGTCCSGTCVDVATDAAHCGSCAKACNTGADPAETCQFGVCSSGSLCIEAIKGAANKTPGCGVCSSSCPSTTSCTTFFGSGTTTCDSKEGSVKSAVAGCTTGKCCLPTSNPVTKSASPSVLPTDGICVA